ncbi:tumor necrosis factor receptor superfamily member 10B-like [Bubalus kerabau]|uniref:tumor necrosis factor receptor superfamily member 10B-like n=1 Tax=Bubalus carabanensis TaxID=3119969 RepID=UPI00244EA3E4|nr:tumor necrosis factor receptor superfamily member 10B-like [Bubalus carabanensis]
MTVPAINLRGPRQRTLPDRKRQRGRKAPASSSAGAGRPGGPKLRFGYLVFVMGVVLWVKAASAISVRKDEIHQQSSAPLERSPQQKLCPPGEEEKNGCTPTKDTECQCKPGTFRGEDAPEFCQKCSTGCPDGKVMVMDCTPWSNIKCVDQESGPSRLMIGIIVTGIIFLIGCVVWCRFKSPFNECWHKVIGFSSIWRPQTLSNCITTQPRVDTVPGVSYAVVPDSLNWPGGSRLNVEGRLAC